MSVMEVFGWSLVGVAIGGFVGGCLIWLMHELRNAPTEVEDASLDDLLDPAEKARAKFTRAGWTEIEPGYWVKDTEDMCALEDIPDADPVFLAEALAGIRSIPTTEEADQ
ncbi:MAG: hypothetical protein ACRDTJ_16375 [Pseudonocardiaceae bacterium]